LSLFLALLGADASAQSPERAMQALAAFDHTTQDYAMMHRRLERPIGRIELGTPVAEINRMIRELSAGIRAQRSDARQGDFFGTDLSQVLRARVNAALLTHGFTTENLRAASRVDGVDYRIVHLQVNDTFPWILGTSMFACVIEALPPLPPELQYRIVDDDLVLIDIHASLIVDILPRVLIDATEEFRAGR